MAVLLIMQASSNAARNYDRNYKGAYLGDPYVGSPCSYTKGSDQGLLDAVHIFRGAHEEAKQQPPAKRSWWARGAALTGVLALGSAVVGVVSGGIYLVSIGWHP